MKNRNSMLLEFRFANFMSFKDMIEFSMLATSDRTNEKGSIVHVNDNDILKCAGVYGANGSGKSNFINAFAYMRYLVCANAKEDGGGLDNNSFKLDATNSEEPSYFETIFYNKGVRYRYGFEVTSKTVISEWLFIHTSSKETTLFTRERDDIKVGRTFKEGRGFEKNTKSHRLFLSVVAELNGETAQSVVDWFGYVRMSSGIYSNDSYTMHILEEHDEKDKQKILEVLQRFDLQIAGIELKMPEDGELLPDDMPKDLQKSLKQYLSKQKKQPTLLIERNVYEKGKRVGKKEFHLEEESDGTQRLVALAGYLVDALDHGSSMVIDEIEAKLHPLVTRKIIEIFNSPEFNKGTAQLIFTTHDTNLLNGGALRRDQVWFTEKDKFGATHMYSLAEYKEKPRKSASFERDYIKGRYGAIPFIGEINEVLYR